MHCLKSIVTQVTMKLDWTPTPTTESENNDLSVEKKLNLHGCLSNFCGLVVGLVEHGFSHQW